MSFLDLEIAEVEAGVYVKELSGDMLERAFDAIDAVEQDPRTAAKGFATICAMSLCDADGNLEYTVDDVGTLMGAPIRRLKAAAEKALDISGLTSGNV